MKLLEAPDYSRAVMEILVVAYSDQEVPDLRISQIHKFKHHCNGFNYDT
jgi:hypothetical protein